VPGNRCTIERITVLADRQSGSEARTAVARQHQITTAHGTLAVEEAGAGTFPVVLIHGNSCCRAIFRHQMRHLADDYRLITFDLPGHGESSNAPDPKRSYTMSGYADAAVGLLDQIGVTEAAVFGWSLGGHIGIEMIPRFPGLRGLMISGTPPVGLADVADGFTPSPHLHLAGQDQLTDEEIDHLVEISTGGPYERFMRDAVARTDGRARKLMFEAFGGGKGIDQRRTVGTSAVPLAVVNGADDPLVDLDYVDGVTYANLWEGTCVRLPGLQHAPAWEAPDVFNPILEQFLRDVTQGGGRSAD
jgi:pimeloyl-ACP methyl ester carboxylesterase